MSNSAISLCGTAYPIRPCTESMIRSKWIDLALVIGAAASLTIAVLASIGQFQALSPYQAASLSYGMYAGTAFFTALALIKLVCRYLITSSEDINNHSSTHNKEKTPQVIKAQHLFKIKTIGGFEIAEPCPFNSAVKSLRIEHAGGERYDCTIHWTSDRYVTNKRTLNTGEVFALIHGLDSDKCFVGKSNHPAYDYFNGLKFFKPAVNLAHTGLTAEKIYNKYFSSLFILSDSNKNEHYSSDTGEF